MNNVKGTILLIDDDSDMLRIGERIIQKAGYQFIAARSGIEGLEKLRSWNPDVIILDYMMPDINGQQFLNTLYFEQEYRKWQHIPVIILTAMINKPEVIDRLFEMGLKAYLVKPFGHRELVNIIENVLRLSSIERLKQTNIVSPSIPLTERDRYSGSILGEVRVSLKSIEGLSKALLQSSEGQISEQQRTDLMAIYNCSRNVLKLLDSKDTANTSVEDSRGAE